MQGLKKDYEYRREAKESNRKRKKDEKGVKRSQKRSPKDPFLCIEGPSMPMHRKEKTQSREDYHSQCIFFFSSFSLPFSSLFPSLFPPSLSFLATLSFQERLSPMHVFIWWEIYIWFFIYNKWIKVTLILSNWLSF